MYTIYGEKYYNDFRRQNFRMTFRSLEDIFNYMKDISHGFSGNVLRGYYFPHKVREKGFNWCGRIHCRNYSDPLYKDFWIYKIENENGILYSNGVYTNGEKFCAKKIEKWLLECIERAKEKPKFVEE